MENRIINGWHFTFNYCGGNTMYECRGAVMYDDEHDETPEPGLWSAAMKLEAELISEGHYAEANHSEKGWVEVTID